MPRARAVAVGQHHRLDGVERVRAHAVFSVSAASCGARGEGGAKGSTSTGVGYVRGKRGIFLRLLQTWTGILTRTYGGLCARKTRPSPPHRREPASRNENTLARRRGHRAARQPASSSSFGDTAGDVPARRCAVQGTPSNPPVQAVSRPARAHCLDAVISSLDSRASVAAHCGRGTGRRDSQQSAFFRRARIGAEDASGERCDLRI